jgi:hypothetical protein
LERITIILCIQKITNKYTGYLKLLCAELQE